jgi:hypothetical protein
VEQSPRNVSRSILGAEFDDLTGARRGDVGLGADETNIETSATFTNLLQREGLFAAIGNFCIGSHFAVQESPYASRSLIELQARVPRADAGGTSRLHARLRDLRHRFIGVAESRSFQRRLIKTVGGYVAEYPINWGWCAGGGITAKGLALGSLAFLDYLTASRVFGPTAVAKALGRLPISGLHDFRRLRKWCSREYIEDTLSTTELQDSGLLSRRAVKQILVEHFSGRKDHHGALLAALDLAHAHRVFVSPRRHRPGMLVAHS